MKNQRKEPYVCMLSESINSLTATVRIDGREVSVVGVPTRIDMRQSDKENAAIKEAERLIKKGLV